MAPLKWLSPSRSPVLAEPHALTPLFFLNRKSEISVGKITNYCAKKNKTWNQAFCMNLSKWCRVNIKFGSHCSGTLFPKWLPKKGQQFWYQISRDVNDNVADHSDHLVLPWLGDASSLETQGSGFTQGDSTVQSHCCNRRNILNPIFNIETSDNQR